ncbi:MAG: RdgB/HAM1 family non-canonical purine NTP pyrophosphatase [Gammaproteobacteria bacterium]|nr:RdgB/HAM1 family non-canonical purine NTP pyrophosphatase [Gammaproteobacteria bacterium]
MSRLKQTVLASNNQHKLRELKSLLRDLPLELIPQSDWNIASVAETGNSFIENALIKARHACQQTGLPSIADDSGLVVPSLNGEPGIRSARFAGEDADSTQNNNLLLQRLYGELDTGIDSRAYFCAVLIYIDSANDPMPEVSLGTWHGQIIRNPRGTNGFGYDPIFLPDEMTLTAAELDPETKNRLSHRAKASRDFVGRLKFRLTI